MKLPSCVLLTQTEIEDEIKNLENPKFFLNAIDIIRMIEINGNIHIFPLLDEEVDMVRYICEKRNCTPILKKMEHILKQRELMQVNIIVDFCDSSFTIVKRNGRNLNIKQNFSRGTVYENIDISEVSLIN